jgi:3-dehydroquinate synthase
VKQKLAVSGLPVDVIEIPAGEASKSMATVLHVTGRMMALQASRKSVLVALGGGVVGDLAGFAASIFKRSVPFVQVATSLIAQVDSSVGGKTGVDLPEGKNLLGTFYQPRAVLIDPRCLDTLPEKEFKNGLAEIIKYGIIRDKALFEILEREQAAIRARDTALMQHLISRSCRIKADVVEVDEKEGGLRRILNFGHTVGHALEAASNYALSHGEAVAVGIVIAAEISRRLGHLNEDSRRRIERVVKQYGLPTTVPGSCTIDTVLGFLASDKKAVGGRIHYVLIRDIGDPFVTADVSRDMVRHILEALRI